MVWYSTPFSTDKHNSATLQHTHCVLLYSLHFTSVKFCQQNNWNRIQNIARVLSKTLVSKHRYPFHNKALCVCLWARPSGRDTGTGVSFTAPPDLSANYSHVCQHAMWRPEPGECRDHYTSTGKISGLSLWGLIFPSSEKEGRNWLWHHQCLQPNKT